jgi:soluble lytic murein transglycosylase
MPSYRITDPADNLYIGFKYYRSMVVMNDGRFMRGMFAYNAGPSRMKRWATAYPELPDDIILEILEYAETRQYGRNITQAALMYGTLYEGRTSSETLDIVVAGRRD